MVNSGLSGSWLKVKKYLTEIKEINFQALKLIRCAHNLNIEIMNNHRRVKGNRMVIEGQGDNFLDI